MSTLPGPPTATVTGDAAIRETDNDAAVSRLSAVKAGYLSDPFAAHFVKRASATPRPPLINVGTFVRTWAIDALVQQFLDAAHSPETGTETRKQIVSLGAGTDSRAFRILDEERKATAAAHLSGTAPSRNRLARYIEVDFPEATSKKAMLIRQKKDLAELLGDDVTISQGGTALLSPKYALVAGDLRDFTSSVAPRLLELLDPALPTLVLAECVFIYLDPMHSESILSWCTSTLGAAGAGVMVVQYDPVGLDDSFGRVMIRNLQTRGLKLLGLPASASLSGQIELLMKLGFDASHAQDIKTIRKTILPAAEQERIAKLEMLDEIEELDLLTAHYSVAWAVKPGNLGVLLDIGL